MLHVLSRLGRLGRRLAGPGLLRRRYEYRGAVTDVTIVPPDKMRLYPTDAHSPDLRAPSSA